MSSREEKRKKRKDLSRGQIKRKRKLKKKIIRGKWRGKDFNYVQTARKARKAHEDEQLVLAYQGKRGENSLVRLKRRDLRRLAVRPKETPR
jgi:hypothetical protein